MYSVLTSVQRAGQWIGCLGCDAFVLEVRKTMNVTIAALAQKVIRFT